MGLWKVLIERKGIYSKHIPAATGSNPSGRPHASGRCPTASDPERSRNAAGKSEELQDPTIPQKKPKYSQGLVLQEGTARGTRCPGCDKVIVQSKGWIDDLGFWDSVILGSDRAQLVGNWKFLHRHKLSLDNPSVIC